MDNITFFIIMAIAIVIIYWSHNNSCLKEKFLCQSSNDKDLLSLTASERCGILSQPKYMIRDIKTRLWLMSGQEEGFSKFLPSNFGTSLLISNEPNEYLPLRLVADPNDYLLSTYNGKGIRVVSNPNNKFYVLEIYIYEHSNIIGYIDESETQKYLQIDSNGHITSTINPDHASRVELIYL
jgi:hypothetical protein